MKRISVLLIVVLLLSALVLPGLAYAKKPAGTPGKGPLGLGITGKPSSTPVKVTVQTGPVVGKLKGKGWSKFVVQGTVTSVELSGSATTSINVDIIKAGKAVVRRLQAAEFAKTDPKNIPIGVDSDTKIRPKNKTLSEGQRVLVKGDIVKNDGTWILKARMIIIKPKPFKR